MICKICNQDKNEVEFLKLAKRHKICKVCQCFYITNNIKSIIDGWSEHEYKIVIDNILNDRVKYIDEILPFLDDKKIEDLIDLLHNHLRIKNKPLILKFSCEFCGKEFTSKMSKFYNKNVFCSKECYYKYKKDNTPKGEESPYFKRVYCNCTNCNKEISVIKYNYDKRNSYGESHNFCSQECYWEFRSKYYIKDKANGYMTSRTSEQKEKQRELVLRMYEDGVFTNKLTRPHKAINELLDKMSIEYKNEYRVAFYSMDIYLKDYDLYIEIMGDYFHSNPTMYEYGKLNKIQLKNNKNDKSKRGYFINNMNKNILNLWETEIRTKIRKREEIIKMYINSELQDYNSFNYSLINNEIVLNNNIVIPYFILNP